MEDMLQDTLMNIGDYGNSFGQSERMRAAWTKELDFKIKDARKEETEYLWFVGDYASYDSRIQGLSRTVATILNKIGLDYGILYDGEKNAGNDVRIETLWLKSISRMEYLSCRSRFHWRRFFFASK